MSLKNNELRSAVRLALYAGATAAVGLSPLPVFAQSDEAGSEKLETIVVTGSRIRRVDIESASPVFSIEKADIEKSGKLTIGDLIQESPSIAGAATNPSVNNGGGTGASNVSLRGLGEERTLLLVNGRRLAYADVNSIPISLVERIDILKDGASAIYGSDAVAGVVNFVLRKDFQGIEATADYGISDRDDGERKGFSLTLGHTSERGNIVIGANYNKQDPVWAGDRDFSAPALYNANGTIYVLGSGSIPNGRFVIPRTVAQGFGINCSGTGANVSVTRSDGVGAGAGANFRCYGGADSYDYSPYNLELTPQERGGLFVTGGYRITDNVEAYVDAFTNKTRSRFIIAPLPVIFGQSNVVLSADSVFNPFGVDIRSGGLRDINGGNREGMYTTTADQFAGGLRGSFGDTWQWDAGVVAGRTSQDSASTGYYLGSGLAAAVGPSFIDPVTGVARCGTLNAPVNDCTPIDLFNLNNSPIVNQASIDALRALQLTVKTHQYSLMKGANFNLTGELFSLPAGAVSVAVGGEYRKDYVNFEPDFISTIIDPAPVRCLTFTDACAAPTNGELSSREFYAELLVPVLADVPFAKSLNLSIGTRHSDYSAFGSTLNSKLGIEWRPFDDLLLRGTVAEVFRAPRIADLYGGVTPSADTYSDPCSGTGLDLNNPACAGLAPGFDQVTQQTAAVYNSNPNLQPEKGKTFTWGVVYDPSWLPGLSTSIDVWKIYLNDTISFYGTQTILDRCYAGSLYFCTLFTRDGSGDIDFVSNDAENIGRTDVSGVDFSVKYRLPETAWGNFRVGLDATYFKEYNSDLFDTRTGTPLGTVHYAGSYFSSSSGGPGNLARWRALGSLSWSLGAFDAAWRARFIGAARFGDTASLPGGGTTIAPGGDPADNSYRMGASTFHNVSFGYNAEAINTRFELGVDNVGDKQPPQLWNYGFNGNTDERTYDVVGRYYWARVGVKF